MENEANQRLRTARETLGLGLREFAAPIGRSFQTVSAWETGRTPISKIVARSIEACHGISSKWLLGGEGEMFVHKLDIQKPSVAQTFVPPISVQPSAGSGNALVDYVEKGSGIPFDTQWLHKTFGVQPDNLCLLEVDGDSMEPTIQPNEMVFVDGLHETPAYRDGVWVLRTRGLLFVKRVHRLAPDDYEITSDNPAYGSLEPDESTRLLGRVVGLPPKRI